MSHWSSNPLIYEISTWVWLHELSARAGHPITLGLVPQEEWDALGVLGVDAVWLMGVWERSPVGIRIANQNPNLNTDFVRALPDYKVEDNVGSPYCVRRYVVDAHLGGPSGLAAARKELAQRGLRLILDFVPNHVAPDHPWLTEHPGYFIQGSEDDLQRVPTEFIKVDGHIIANGRDPYFAPWPDVAQLNVFDPGLRKAVIETVNSIADQCDGMRCDMAMLLLNDIFARTWGERAGAIPATEYWSDVIPAVRAKHPDVLFMAEAYWDLEWQLQHQGFDFCYDKRLYDRLENDSAEDVRLHLCADLDYQSKLVRFIENHDEPRAAAVFSPEKERVAAVTVASLKGAKLLYEGQFEGRRVRLPVFLGRRPDEFADLDLRAFYRDLLRAVQAHSLRAGEWQLCERTGWQDNNSYLNLVAWCWRSPGSRVLIVVNLSPQPSQAHVHVPWDDLKGRTWSCTDSFSGQVFVRSGDDMSGSGLYVDLPPWGFHFLEMV